VAEPIIKKLYVNPDGTATFICPNCGCARRESAEQYKDHKGSIKIECPCTNVYEIELEFRKYYRKETYLEGIYYRSAHSDDWGKMVVKNLSMGGCGLETINTCTLVEGEEIKLEFMLDGRRGITIRKKAVVTEIEGRYVGCKFSQPPGFVDPDLGFFLKAN
jgi:hypothetical protein